MRYIVDQSGKIEHTNTLTVVAVANGTVRALKISASEKRILIDILRARDYPTRVFVLKIFAALVFLVLKGSGADEIVIDREYPGHEGTIKSVLFSLYQKSRQNVPDISFTEIGRKTLAHKVAIETYRGKRKPDMVATADDVIRLFLRKNGKIKRVGALPPGERALSLDRG